MARFFGLYGWALRDAYACVWRDHVRQFWRDGAPSRTRGVGFVERPAFIWPLLLWAAADLVVRFWQETQAQFRLIAFDRETRRIARARSA